MIRLAFLLLLLLAAPAEAAFTARATASGTFTAAAQFPPRNVTPPSIGGSGLAGDPLTASPGTWERLHQAPTMRWEVEGPGGWAAVGQGSTYTPVAAGRVRVVVEGVASEAVAVAAWGGGLRGEYSTSQELAFPRLTRLDPTIAFDWGYGSPAAGIGTEFAARWTGRIRSRFTETYTLRATGDNMTLRVDGQLLTDGRVALTAGRDHVIAVEMHDRIAGADARLEWESARQPRELVPSSHLAPPAHGLRAEYFDRADLAGPALTWLDPHVDHAWELERPDVRMTSAAWSARWTGHVLPPATDAYRFHVSGGARLWVDGRLVLDTWSSAPASAVSDEVRLEAGRAHAIRLEFRSGSRSRAWLAWARPGQQGQTVPTDRLLPSIPPSQERLP